MCKIVIFGGTTEGRKLADYCAGHDIDAKVCVVSEYGASLLPVSPRITVCQGARSREEMEVFFYHEKPGLVFDATHPYATAVTENIRQACKSLHVSYIRVDRDSRTQEAKGNVYWVSSAQEAAEYLSHTEGSIFLTTGSKELAVFAGMRDFEKRVYARVLPDERVVKLCRDMGLAGSHIMALQGPFSVEMNRAMIDMTKAAYLVTKESGTAGGFLEKMEAARELGVKTVVIGRPKKPEGISVNEAIQVLKPWGRTGICRVSLIGIGMGGEGQLTGEAVLHLEKAQAVAGAGRMVESVAKWWGEKEIFISYKPEEIALWLEEHSYLEEVAVLYSGDTGFYSGAGAMAKRLRQESRRYEVVMVPGISTVSYLCGRLKTSWEDVYLGSLHGRTGDVEEMLKSHRRVFLLMEGKTSVERLCRKLVGAGYGSIWMSVGISLSYPEERIVAGSAKRLKEMFEEEESFREGLCAVLLEQDRDNER